MEDGVAVFLTGADARIGHQPPQPPGTNAFSGTQINRAFHFAGGRVLGRMPLTASYTAEMWVWNGLPIDARPVTGYFFARSAPHANDAGESLAIRGTARPNQSGRLMVSSSTGQGEPLVGRTVLTLRRWHHVVLVHDQEQVSVYLNGQTEPEIAGNLNRALPPGEQVIIVGGSHDGSFNFEGKLDEVAIYPRALSPNEIRGHFQAAELSP